MFKRSAIILLVMMALVTGCASLTMRAPKEPIKVDISMRLDVYQHVQEDIDEVESLVSGTGGSSSVISPAGFFVGTAFAQEEGLSGRVKEAALRRRDRRSELRSYQAKGVIGENAYGFVEVHDQARADEKVRKMVINENDDRDIIYKSIAAGNNAPIEGVQTMYADRLQEDVPLGTPVQRLNRSTNKYEWEIK